MSERGIAIDVLSARHGDTLRIISGRDHGTGRRRPEDLAGLDVEVADLLRMKLVRLTPFGRAERLTEAGRETLQSIDRLSPRRQARESRGAS